VTRQTREFVFGDDRAHFRRDYKILAAAIHCEDPGEKGVDIGSGQGWLVEELDGLGHDIVGVEIDVRAAKHMTPRAKELTRLGSFWELETSPEKVDFVTCIEVAEHIDPAWTSRLIAMIARQKPAKVFFTAATPHQPGDGHINCRPQTHWICTFDEYAYELDLGATSRMIQATAPLYHPDRCFWLNDNIMVFERC
jgi:cyclopropane fatty-acyl-phospholipid synthase-like methyltransferase